MTDVPNLVSDLVSAEIEQLRIVLVVQPLRRSVGHDDVSSVWGPSDMCGIIIPLIAHMSGDVVMGQELDKSDIQAA